MARELMRLARFISVGLVTGAAGHSALFRVLIQINAFDCHAADATRWVW